MSESAKASSRKAAEKAGDPMASKTEKTEAVDAGKSKNPMGQKAKAHGHEEHEGEGTGGDSPDVS